MNSFKNKKALIIVESPFQLLCAYEAIDYFGFDSEVYIRLTKKEVTNQQIINIVKTLKIKNIIYFELPVKNWLKTFIIIFKLKLKKYDYYVLGNYLSGFLNIFIKVVSSEKIILLEDGVATFKVQRLLEKKSLPIALFTIFDIVKFNNQTIYRHTFNTLNSLFSRNNIRDDVFIGGKLVDLDILSLESYLSVIKEATKDNKGKKIIYFPHRETSEKVMSSIITIENIEVIYPSSTIELYLLEKGMHPQNIYSILSTALFTLSILFKDADVIAYRPKFNKNERENDIEKLYESFENHDTISVKKVS